MKTSVVAFGDTAALVETGDVVRAHRLAAALELAVTEGRAPAGLQEIVIGFDSVVVQFRPDPARHADRLRWLHAVASRIDASPADECGEDVTATWARGGATVEIPTDFDGPDLDAAASIIGATTTEVITLLTGADLRVAFLGFAPGFPYLVGLPPPLAGLRRLPTPRPSVPAGSVAVAGGFASVYPQSTPGGWLLLGRTQVRLFDPDRPPYATLAPGDRVRVTVAPGGPAARAGARGAAGDDGDAVADPRGPRAPLSARGPRWAEVLRPGPLSLIQDAGRRGLAGIGIPGAGAADPESMTLANRLVGNADDAAVLEITVEGPALRFAVAAHCAVVGGSAGAVDLAVDGLACRDGSVVPVGPGQVLEIGRVRTGVRAYVAVAGGFDTPSVVDSRSSDLLCGMGPGPLVVGDRLGLGPPGRPHGALALPAGPPAGTARRLRVIAGPHDLGREAWNHLLDAPWRVDGASNRIGVRLAGPRPVPGAGERSIASTGMVTGAVQVPPDGYPIVLMPDHATVGGYPVIGSVIATDLHVLGQLGPGDPVRFVGIDLDHALRVTARQEKTLSSRVTGWFPTRAAT